MSWQSIWKLMLFCAIAGCACFANAETWLSASGTPQAERPATTLSLQAEELPSSPSEVGHTVQGSPSAASPDRPLRRLTFRQAIDLALQQSPDVVTARAGFAVADATRKVSSVYPWNPAVQLSIDPYTRDEQGNFLAIRNQVTVTQTIELAHQPTYRRRAADASWNQQLALIAQAELASVLTEMRSYIDALYRKGLYETADKTAQLQAKTVAILDRRVKAGLSTPNERLTASVAARQSARLATIAGSDYQVAMSTLRTALGVVAKDEVSLLDELHSYRFRPIAEIVGSSPPDSASCIDGSPNEVTNWLDNRPDIISSRFAVSAAHANLDLARANVRPNLSTGPTYERDESGTLFFGVTAQMDVPVWNSGGPLVHQRAAELQQQMITFKELQKRAELQATAAIRRYQRAFEVCKNSMAAGIAADNDNKTIQDAFEQGQATILEVLSIQDSLNQEQKSQLDIENELSQAAVDIVAALAIDPEQMFELSDSNSQNSVKPSISPGAPQR
jgi:outer membrane protein, heavy metal efflux system